MNHSHDSEHESSKKDNSRQLELLDTLIDNIIMRLRDKSCQPRVRDALLAIQLRQKVADSSEAEKIFWGMIDDIRRSELSKPLTIQSRIKNTISRLEADVKNGILPVKLITDAFNESRYGQTRFTYRRMGGLLSAMGFTKTKTSNGCYAILWDQDLLFSDASSDADNSPTDDEPHHSDIDQDVENEKGVPKRPENPESPVQTSDPPFLKGEFEDL